MIAIAKEWCDICPGGVSVGSSLDQCSNSMPSFHPVDVIPRGDSQRIASPPSPPASLHLKKLISYLN